MDKRPWGYAEIITILVSLSSIVILTAIHLLPANFVLPRYSTATTPEQLAGSTDYANQFANDTIPPHRLTGDIPRLDLNLSDITLEEINSSPKETRYPNNTLTLTIDSETTTYDEVELKGHGNTTWYDIQGKHPYQIKFSTKTDLFNMGASKKYILLANYFDASFIRNDIALYLESLLNETYPVRGEYVELYVDDVYRGLYYLTTKVEIGSSRVHLKNPDGLLVELDNVWPEDGSCYHTTTHDCLTINDSVDDSREDTAMRRFLADFNKLVSAIRHRDYHTIEQLIDVNSFARYYLLSEFAVNPDAYATSFYIHQNGPADKIHAGPGWDFDLSLGNQEWITSYSPIYSPDTLHAMNHYIYQDTQYITIIADLAKIPEFINAVKNTWQQYMSGRKDNLLNYTQDRAIYIAEAAAKDEAYQKHSDFTSSVDELLDWLSRRYDLFEQEYGDI